MSALIQSSSLILHIGRLNSGFVQQDLSSWPPPWVQTCLQCSDGQNLISIDLASKLTQAIWFIKCREMCYPLDKLLLHWLSDAEMKTHWWLCTYVADFALATWLYPKPKKMNHFTFWNCSFFTMVIDPLCAEFLQILSKARHISRATLVLNWSSFGTKAQKKTLNSFSLSKLSVWFICLLH